MAIIARKPETTFTPCPEGLYQAVCVDVVDVGMIKTSFGEKHMVRIVWQVDVENPDTDKRFDVRRSYHLSLHEDATLRKHLECWRGRKFTEEELAGFDLEKLLGANCQIQVVQDLGNSGNVFANVQAVVPAPKGVPKMAPIDYVRQNDRPKTQGNGRGNGAEPTADDVPF